MGTEILHENVTWATALGCRRTQEDRHFYMRIAQAGCYGWLLAVMDGHGGSTAAEICEREIGVQFALNDAKKAEKALRVLVHKLNNRTKHLLKAGTTLSVACILESHDKASIAILGDSPAVVIDTDNNVIIHWGHNVRTNLRERKSAEERGDFYRNGYIVEPSGDVGIQMSRTLGDAEFGRIISRTPEIHTVSKPRWIALATDGMISQGNSSVAEFVALGLHGADAKRLMQWAQQRVLSDNTSVLVWKEQTWKSQT